MGLEEIIYLIGNLFQTVILYKFFNIGFIQKHTKKLTELLVFSFYFFATSSIYLFIENPFITLAANIIIFVGIATIYKSSWKARIFTTITILVVTVLTEIAAVFLVTSIGVTNQVIEYDIELITMHVTSKIFLYVAVLLFEKYTSNKKSTDLPLASWVLITLIPLFSLITAIVLYVEVANPVSIVVSTVALFVVNTFVFFLYNRQSEVYSNVADQQVLKQQNKAYGEQLKIMQDSLENVRLIKHDMKNHILTLKDLVSKDSLEDLGKYINRAEGFLETNDEISSGHSTIDSILNYKKAQASLLGVDLVVSANVPKELLVDNFDLTVILGNIIDNSIEAASRTENKQVNVSISFDRSILYLTTRNDYNKSFEKSKNKKDRGLGLISVKKVINKYNGLLTTNSTSKYFEVQIMLYT